MPESAREEAERLVAAVLAMAGDSSAARERVTAGLGALGETVAGMVGRWATDPTGPAVRQSWSTGSAECCVCPICRVIATLRDPSPESAEQLASSAGDVAAGMASLLRAMSVLGGERSRRTRPARPPATRTGAAAHPDNPDQTWSAVTRADEPGNRPEDAWSAATNAAPPAHGTPGEVRDGAEDNSDPWSAATTASAAAATAEHAAELAARRAAARQAAAEAERRVAEAVAAAKARREAAAAGGDPGSGGSAAGSETGDTESGAGPDTRTPRRFDVWAAATAEMGVTSGAPPGLVDHEVAGGPAPAERDGGAT